MTRVDEQGRPKPPLAGDEPATLVAWLDFLRATIAWKCSGLDPAALRTTVGASAMTLGGLLKHLAEVEDTHFATWLLGREPGPPWNAVDWDAEPDWSWRSAADDSPEELLTLWHQACDRSRAVVEEALAKGGLEQLGSIVSSDGQSPTLRYILMALIEEYARHIGHADLLREAIDGLTGE